MTLNSHPFGKAATTQVKGPSRIVEDIMHETLHSQVGIMGWVLLVLDRLHLVNGILLVEVVGVSEWHTLLKSESKLWSADANQWLLVGPPHSVVVAEVTSPKLSHID